MPSGTEWRNPRRYLLLALLVPGLSLVIYGFMSQKLIEGGIGTLWLLSVCWLGGHIDNWNWTGMGPETQPKSDELDIKPGKTLWDLLQLIIVPAVLTLGVVWFNDRQGAAQSERAQIQAATDRAAAREQARDTVLTGYFSELSDLILKDKLGPGANDGVRAIARARTLTALTQLTGSPPRQSNVVRFLSESDLIPVVDLSIVNLQGVSLEGFNLSCPRPPRNQRYCADLSYAWLNHTNLKYDHLAYANLSFAHLSHAGLLHANLSESRLRHADLSYADLSHANLTDADLSGATIGGVTWRHTKCPDGTWSDRTSTSSQSCARHLLFIRAQMTMTPAPRSYRASLDAETIPRASCTATIASSVRGHHSPVSGPTERAGSSGIVSWSWNTAKMRRGPYRRVNEGQVTCSYRGQLTTASVRETT
ncbi:MAG TPA: pentapeptide repeat-containing protein [Chloroflexota bacterium]